jgi:hypothetical protein
LFNKLHTNINEVSGNIFLSEKFPGKNIDFSLTWKTSPSLEELGVFEIELKTPLDTTQTLNAFIWMPEMGHGSSPIEISKTSSLNYIFSEVAFIMPGLWVLHIELLENNQVVEKWQKSIVL